MCVALCAIYELVQRSTLNGHLFLVTSGRFLHSIPLVQKGVNAFPYEGLWHDDR